MPGIGSLHDVAVMPPFLPPARILAVPGRGEVFLRYHEGSPDAPLLLLLHGWTATADLQWLTVYEALAQQFSFVAVDLRGHGRSLRSLEPFSLEAAADDVAAAVRALGLGPAIAVGYSMGGPVALHLACRHPDLTTGVVLCATAMGFRGSRRDRVRWWSLLLLEAVLRSRFSGLVSERNLTKAAAANPALVPWLSWLRAESTRGDPAALVEAGRALRDFDARTLLDELCLPAGVICTTEDTLVRPAHQRELAEALDASLVEVAGDHFCYWSDPAGFGQALEAALAHVVSRTSSRGHAARAAPPRRGASAPGG